MSCFHLLAMWQNPMSQTPKPHDDMRQAKHNECRVLTHCCVPPPGAPHPPSSHPCLPQQQAFCCSPDRHLAIPRIHQKHLPPTKSAHHLQLNQRHWPCTRQNARHWQNHEQARQRAKTRGKPGFRVAVSGRTFNPRPQQGQRSRDHDSKTHNLKTADK